MGAFAAMMVLPIVFCGQSGDDEKKIEFAKRVRAAYEELGSLYFEAEVSGHEWASIDGVGARGRVCELFKVWMADGPRFRVEMFAGTESVGAVVCDGNEVTDWYPAEKSYTRYPMPAFDQEYELGCRLFANKELREFCECWVDARGPFGARLEAQLTAAETRRVKSSRVGEVLCDVFETQARLTPSFLLSMNQTVRSYFDRDTHLLLKQKRVFTGVGLAWSRFTLTIKYRNVQPNVELPPDIFVFNPPDSAVFIPPDDPRFQPKEEVKLTGRPAPAFSLPIVETKRDKKQPAEAEPSDRVQTVSLADFKGKKPVLLVFWATWCWPCQKEIPSLIKLHNELGNKGLAIVSINGGDKSIDDIRSFLKRRPLPFPVSYDEKGEATLAYGAKAIPYTILIDKSGMVVRTWRGWIGEEEEKEIREEVAKLLKD